MIKEKTVLILGAGASMPYKLPSGPGLKALMAKELMAFGRRSLTQPQHGFKIELLGEFRDYLLRTPAMSIDVWLGIESNQRFLDVGKSYLAKVLLNCERDAAIFDDILESHLPTEKTYPCWYRHLFQHLDGPLEDFHKNQLSVITFNYDRSFEHFIYESLKANFSSEPVDNIVKQAETLPVIHVHGKLGNLPWQNVRDNIPYNSPSNDTNVRLAAQQISIIHEAEDASKEFEEARKLLIEAKNIYILGFGYHETNLKRLGLKSIQSGSKNIRGTILGLSPTTIRIADLHTNASHMSRDNKLKNQTTYEFLYKNIDFK